ncbi:MAG: hypothetical protein KKG70_03870 [Proteobacteria bacterium]|nr:hypothetical protein [Pseudomonadota bacterium]
MNEADIQALLLLDQQTILSVFAELRAVVADTAQLSEDTVRDNALLIYALNAGVPIIFEDNAILSALEGSAEFNHGSQALAALLGLGLESQVQVLLPGAGANGEDVIYALGAGEIMELGNPPIDAPPIPFTEGTEGNGEPYPSPAIAATAVKAPTKPTKSAKSSKSATPVKSAKESREWSDFYIDGTAYHGLDNCSDEYVKAYSVKRWGNWFWSANNQEEVNDIKWTVLLMVSKHPSDASKRFKQVLVYVPDDSGFYQWSNLQFNDIDDQGYFMHRATIWMGPVKMDACDTFVNPTFLTRKVYGPANFHTAYRETEESFSLSRNGSGNCTVKYYGEIDLRYGYGLFRDDYANLGKFRFYEREKENHIDVCCNIDDQFDDAFENRPYSSHDGLAMGKGDEGNPWTGGTFGGYYRALGPNVYTLWQAPYSTTDLQRFKVQSQMEVLNVWTDLLYRKHSKEYSNTRKFMFKVNFEKMWYYSE